MTHLYQLRRNDLLHILENHVDIFIDSLGVYLHKKFHIEIDKEANPVYKSPYHVPSIHISTFKKELDHLVNIGVLLYQNEIEWASP